MRNNKRIVYALMTFVIKILVLVAGYYYLASRILKATNQNELLTATYYSAIFAGIVLLLLLMFRWSGFFERLFACILGLGAFVLPLLQHIGGELPVNFGFLLIYTGIILIGAILAFFILFKGHRY